MQIFVVSNNVLVFRFLKLGQIIIQNRFYSQCFGVENLRVQVVPNNQYLIDTEVVVCKNFLKNVAFG